MNEISNLLGTLTTFVILALIVGGVLAFIIVGIMSEQRGRSTGIWMLLSLIYTPFPIIVFLFFLGETDKKRRERILEEEAIRDKYRISSFEQKMHDKIKDIEDNLIEHNRYKPRF